MRSHGFSGKEGGGVSVVANRVKRGGGGKWAVEN